MIEDNIIKLNLHVGENIDIKKEININSLIYFFSTKNFKLSFFRSNSQIS